MTSPNAKISDVKTNQNPPPPAAPSRGCSTVGKVAGVAALFLVLSGAGVGVLFYLKLQQYAVIAYGTGGASAAVIIGVAIKSCCSSRSTIQVDGKNKTQTKSAAVINEKKGLTQAEKADKAYLDWVENGGLVEAAVEGGHYEATDTQYAAIYFPDIPRDQTRIYFLLPSFARPADALLQPLIDIPEGNQRPITLSKQPSDIDSMEYSQWYVKSVLWAAATNEDGSLAPAGRALMATGNKPIYIAAEAGTNVTLKRVGGAACHIETKEISNKPHLVIHQGWYAKLVEELRDTLKELYGTSSPSANP